MFSASYFKQQYHLESGEKMVIKGHSASLALLLSVTIGVADAIRSLKDGPMIDTEGREYKSALRTDAGNIRGQQLNDKPTVRVQCTETSMIVAVKADLYKNGRLVSPGELFLGEAGPSQSVQCQAVAAGDTEYVIEAGLQDCGTKLTVSCYCLIMLHSFMCVKVMTRFERVFIFRYLGTL